MSTIHRNLTGSDLHEPKGADTALSGQVYVSDGAGSGSWVDASSIITSTAFSAGDTKLTWKTVADSGWIMYVYGTIGDGSSSATIRANADTANLYKVIWDGTNNTDCPVYTSGGTPTTRGVSAAADFAAHKRILLPDLSQRVLGVAGSYNTGGLTSRALGAFHGAESTALVASQIPTITSTVSASGSISASTNANTVALTTSSTGGGAFGLNVISSLGTGSVSGTASVSGSATSNNTSGASHTNYQPTGYMNLMIKL